MSAKPIKLIIEKTPVAVPEQRIHAFLASLAVRRPVFHSEADFQHALAWEMHLACPTAHIQLEKQVAAEGARVHLDLLCQSDVDKFAVELKYKTRATKIAHGAEDYSLRNQSAQDIGRHDFIRDVHRLEKYVHAHPGSDGFAILLTNDRTYWIESKKSDSVDLQFRVHDGRVLQGGVSWGAKAAAGTKHKRENPIALGGNYKMSWRNYSSFGKGIADEFRYVLVHVRSDPSLPGSEHG